MGTICRPAVPYKLRLWHLNAFADFNSRIPLISRNSHSLGTPPTLHGPPVTCVCSGNTYSLAFPPSSFWLLVVLALRPYALENLYRLESDFKTLLYDLSAAFTFSLIRPVNTREIDRRTKATRNDIRVFKKYSLNV
jgi:hypothetical protein